MSIIPSPIIAILFALATIIHGIFVEKHYVSRSSIWFNCANVLILILTLDFSRVMAIVFLVIYAVLGWYLIRLKGHGEVKQLFGSKPYGSLSLALALDELNGSIWFRYILTYLEQLSHTQFEFIENNIILFSWAIILIVVVIIQLVVIKKNIRLPLLHAKETED
jgi:hypothetical protein